MRFIKGSFYSESVIWFSNLHISKKKYSKYLSWAWNLNLLFTGNFNFNLEIGKTEKKTPLENIRPFVFCKIGENMQWVRKKKYFKPPTSQTKFFFKSVTPQVGPNFNGDRLHLASLLSLGETTRIMTIVYNIWQPIETFPISLLKIAKTQ